MEVTHVVAGINLKYKDNAPHVLLGLKPSGNWEFPGGKVQFQEAITDALEREWIEELDVMVSASEVKYFRVETDKYNIDFHFVDILSVNGEVGSPIAVEHVEVKYYPISELGELKMLDTNRIIAELLQDDYN